MTTEQPRYFIGFLIEGEAATQHIALTKTISETFQTWEIHKQIPPHVTIFRPFQTDDISSIKKLLHEWTRGKPPSGTMALSHFGHFEDRVVFISVDPDSSSRQMIEDLRKTLQTIPTMPPEDFPTWYPHATLANHLSPEDIRQIWNYVLTLKKPNFTLPLNNITLFRNEGTWTWGVEEIFRLDC